jgi:hypothetical protein
LTVFIWPLWRLCPRLRLAGVAPGFESFHQHGRFDTGGDLDDQVHLAALRLKARQIRRCAVHVHIVECVDSVAIALVHDVADFVLRVPFLHHRTEVLVVVRVPVERVDSQHHAADFGAAEFHLRHLNVVLGQGRLLCSQYRANLKEASTCVRHDAPREVLSLTGLIL